MKLLRAAVLISFSFTAVAHAESNIPDIWKAKCKSCHGVGGKADTKSEGELIDIKDRPKLFHVCDTSCSNLTEA